MNTWIIAASIAFAFTFALMLYHNKMFWFKPAAVTLLFIIANMVYFSFDSIKGWPTSEKITKGYLVFATIVEPSGSYPGAIYLYVDVDESDLHWYDKFVNYVYWDDNAPRSFYLPYSEKTSKDMRQATEAMKNGYIVEITGDSAEAQGDGQDATNVDNGNGGESQPDGGSAQDYKVPHLKLIDPRERSGKVKQ